MTRFDFLHDGLPDAIEGALALRLPRRLRSAATAFATVLCVLCAAGLFESSRTAAATALEGSESARLDAARARLAAANLELRDVNALLETQRRLRALHGSGSRVVRELAAIGNVVPRGVWLSSVEPAVAGFDIDGEAVNVGALRTVLANFVAAGGSGKVRLLRMTRVARASERALVSFAVHVQAQ